MDSSPPYLSILGVFALLSVLAVGGGAAVLPETKALTITHFHWLADDEFRDIYGLGQLSPGPNMLMVIAIGYWVAGYPGAALAFFGFFLPSSFICFGAARLWNRFEGSQWRLAIQRGMAPIVVGLMGAGTVSVAKVAIEGWITAVLALAVFGVLLARKINPAYLVAVGGVIGYFFLV